MNNIIFKTTVFILFEIIMTIIIPFLDFYIGIKYFNDITCDTDTFIKMPIWLIIKGVFAAISTIFIFIIIITGKNSFVLKVSKKILIQKLTLIIFLFFLMTYSLILKKKQFINNFKL